MALHPASTSIAESAAAPVNTSAAAWAGTLCATPATSALAATLARLKTSALRTFLVVGALCLGIALLLTAIDGRGFGYKLIYALAIGTCCTLLVDSVRLGTAWLTDRTRRARGLVAHGSAAVTGWRGVIPGALLAVVLGPPAGLWLGDQMTGFTSPSLLSFSSGSSRVTLVMSLLATLIAVLVISTLERLASARVVAESAQRQAAENQLRLLQSQLEPHMLFNTLANLRVLIALDPLRAQAMLDRLIAFLRATLQASRAASQPLAAEFAHLDDYLSLMAVRMGPRLAVSLELAPELSALPVPPLLLQPLLENAIKHGLEPKVEGGRIEVRAWREGALLHLAVRDTGVGLGAAPAVAGSSFGLEQVRARLATLFGGRAHFSLLPAADAEGGMLAHISLPLD